MSPFFIGFLCGVATLVFLASCSRDAKRDDSDTPTKRSGLRVHTDAKTGVQYLSTMAGGVTPRLNPDGSLVVVGVEKGEP